jgi:tetratricopeptide (TPR) repeat protein
MKLRTTMFSTRPCSRSTRASGRFVRGLVAPALMTLFGAVFGVGIADATPYTPQSDDAILMRVPAAVQQRELQPLRHALAENPQDLTAALNLSKAYLDLGRREGDPRFISYAQATLANWIQRPDAPADALVLTAVALQSLHRFDDSLALLSRALRIEPRNAQAWLTRATILQVRGEFAAARQSCVHLIGIADPVIALACAGATNAMTGKLQQSYAALTALMSTGQGRAAAVDSWLLGQLGEMAVRLNDSLAAERHFQAAMRADPRDVQVKAEYADLLLREQRWNEVTAMLADNEAQDPLLLRLAIAGHHLDSAQGRRWGDLYEERYQAALLDGDTTHLREHARYLLEVRGATSQALQLAQRNWQVQREPADIRIYWQSADRDSRAALSQWIAANHYQDAVLQEASR